MKLILLLWIVLYVWIMYGLLLPFSVTHYWQTLNEPKLSGQVIVEEMRYEHFRRNDSSYRLALKGQNNAPSFHFNRRGTNPLSHQLDSTLLDSKRVWEALKNTSINDTISVKWITRTSKSPIFTSINGKSNIGYFNAQKGLGLVFDILMMIVISVFSLTVIYSLITAKPD